MSCILFGLAIGLALFVGFIGTLVVLGATERPGCNRLGGGDDHC